MNANDAHNKELYISARHRHSIGRANMTDAAIVAEQEKEIERYRNKIKWLEKGLREAFGDVGEIEAQGVKYTFTITEAVIEQRVDCVATITIKGDVQGVRMKTVCCPNCNAPVQPGQRKCEYCGSWFDVPEVEQIILYADGKPFEIAERVNDFMTRDEARRMYLNATNE